MGWTGAGAGPRTDVIVVHATGPGPNATHGSTSFEPDSAWQAEQVATLYAQSDRRHTYLGDWHTHPNGRGIPSQQDRRTLATIARSPAARAPHPLFVIVEDQPVGPLMAWRWCAWWRPLQRLNVRTTS